MTRDQTAKLINVFLRYDEIDLVYLYGSHAKGRVRKGSDLDLAVSARVEDFAGLKLDLLEQLALAGFERVDIAFFQQSTPLLKFQMVRYNCLLYCRPGMSSGSLFSRCLKEYFDLEPTLRLQRAAYKERIRHG